MKKMIVLVLSLVGFLSTQAQDATQKLIDNSDVTWIAESKAFISFENGAHRARYDDGFFLENRGNVSGAQLLKIDPNALCEQKYSSYFLSKKINDGLEAGNLQAYNEKGQEITEYVLDEMIVSIDTLVTFDPNTYEKKVEIAKGKVLYDWYEVTLVYYYDAKKKEMHSILKSLAPIVRIEKQDNGENRLPTVKQYESFIIPMEQEGITALNLNNESVVWAKLSDLNTLDFSKAKILKGNTALTLKTIFHDNILDGEYTGFQNREGCDNEIVDTDWLKEYKKNNSGKSNSTNSFGDIDLLGMRHFWYWDADKSQLVCELKSARFYNEYFSDTGEFLYNVMMYEVDFYQ